MAISLVTVRLSETIEAELYLEQCEFQDGIHLQNPETGLYMAAWPDYKHMYWSTQKDINQTFTIDRANGNKLITAHETYIADTFKNDMLWQIYAGYEDECFAVRLVDYDANEETVKDKNTNETKTEDKTNIEEDTNTLKLLEEQLEKDFENNLVEQEDEIQDDSEPLVSAQKQKKEKAAPVPKQKKEKNETEIDDTSSSSAVSTSSSGEKKAPGPAAVALKNFMETKREEFKEKHPEMKKGDLTKEMKRAWKEDLTKEEKKTYYPSK